MTSASISDSDSLTIQWKVEQTVNMIVLNVKEC